MENLGRLLSGECFYGDGTIDVGPHRIHRDGSISREQLNEHFSDFKIPRKNEKFFEEPSIAVFSCLNRLQHLFTEDTVLFVNPGPANSSLKEFQQWAGENDPSSKDLLTSMRASSVVKLLPNILMSNLSINLGLCGENLITSGTSVLSARLLGMAVQRIEQGEDEAAVVASASFPYQYFNIDAYLRFFGEEFFEPPLCEGASACVLSANKPVDGEICGRIRSVRVFRKCPAHNSDIRDFLAARGYEPDRYEKVLFSPSAAGNFLAATEPFSALALAHFLTERASQNTAISVCSDIFGNVSVVEVEGTG